ncbi:hypothetical protein GMSM_26440 [Geomonas sp. Red276]
MNIKWIFGLAVAALVQLFPQLALAGLSQEPILRVETGMHTAMIKKIAVDAAGRWLVSASDDKTVRVWELTDQAKGAAVMALLPSRVLRPPIGAGNEGKIFAVAISPDGSTVVCGGWTGWDINRFASLHFFDRASGKLLKKVDGFPNVIQSLAWSRDGKSLAVGLGAGKGVYLMRASDSKLAGIDSEYGNDCYALDFDAAGRLVTASWDGFVRLYDANFKLIAKERSPNGERPYAVAFSADGARIAVGCDDARKVAVLSGKDLSPLYIAPGGADGGTLFSVAWSADGAYLFAAGSHRGDGKYLVRRWEQGGQGLYRDFPLAEGDVMQLLTLPGGRLAFASVSPEVGIAGVDGALAIRLGSGTVSFRDSPLLVSADGSTVGFSYGSGPAASAAFSVLDRSFSGREAKAGLKEPNTAAQRFGLSRTPDGFLAVHGVRLPLEEHEAVRSLAISPDGSRLLLGTDWNLRCFNNGGREMWRIAAPGNTWGVNVAGNGMVAVAAFADGTIRWFRLADGAELLAFFPHADRKRWVLWTPSGYYQASIGGEELAGWHLNNGGEAAADFFPLARFRSVYCRPDVIARVLEMADERRAIKVADLAAGRSPAPASLRTLLPPIVTVTGPADGIQVEGGEATVSFALRSPSGEKVTGIKFLVNGRPVTSREKSAQAGDLREASVSVPEGESEITVIAENRYAASEPATVKVVRTKAPEAPVEQISFLPRLFILSIGVGAYPDKELTLNFASKDAQDFAALMQGQKGGLYGEVNTKVMTDAGATRDVILDGLKWLRREAGERDVAVVFLSGHGITEPSGGYYFLPVNGDPKKLAQTGVVFTEIRNTLMSLPGKAVLFVDTCHSGDVMGGRSATSDVSAVVNELSSAENGVVVFASSTGRQYSLEDESWGNGAFTKALVEGVKGKADYTGKGKISVTSLDLWISERVQELTDGKQTPTTAKPRTIPDFTLAVKR